MTLPLLATPHPGWDCKPIPWPRSDDISIPSYRFACEAWRRHYNPRAWLSTIPFNLADDAAAFHTLGEALEHLYAWLNGRPHLSDRVKIGLAMWASEPGGDRYFILGIISNT